eukprot:CAMPEP_0181181762 /NCGR_PEP_ID=MMETSP1096-20121128/7513_1 /TAXON_ID=156174 ORGANISM="Chrysochromulina ericina, Strain CCMP281" /NCGR_SAMPLE_ID=MMETSP1096 /ASSEMBLY_ACC=CAM_ASM_000453 /LENGTH=52 /DNA_ID=CAMNT_0023270293 /DNA_START=1342 /DNA_END=1498 /DNA_ORIENTATION=+
MRTTLALPIPASQRTPALAHLANPTSANSTSAHVTLAHVTLAHVTLAHVTLA